MATKRVNATPSLGIIDSLDRLASMVRKNHPEVPDNIVLVLASGKTRKGAKHGHFAPESWEGSMHEILLSSESLARGAEATLGTLIHELAHATAAATGVRDTSNNGRYHNKRFKEVATRLGIELEQGPTIGWSITTLPAATAERYKLGLEFLDKSITTYRKGLDLSQTTITLPPKAPRNRTKAPMVCGCDDEVTVSIQWFERMGQHLRCENCNEYYELRA